MPEFSTTIREAMTHARYVCLFGIGTLLTDCYRQLALIIGREPDYLCDNAQEKWGRHFFDKKCISPHQLAELKEEVVVIITIKNYEAVYRQLSDMACKEIFIASYDRCCNTVADVKRIGDTQVAKFHQKSSAISIKGKWTFITGAARGIGRQIAVEMAKLGSHIIGHSRSIAHTKEVGDICSSLGVSFIPVSAELGILAEVERMLSQLVHQAPSIDIVYNNAAISPPCPSGFWNSPAHDYIASYTVNTVAPIRICQRLIPPMIKRGFGRVINISSSIQKRPGEMAYACSKAALDKFVHDLSPSLHCSGVMLTLLDPGWLSTDMGGLNAPHAVESVIPGALLGALLDGDINGRWFSAQDYRGLNLVKAMQKAKFIMARRVELCA
jgi:3-oxoacyl-[acyl-carrier protein] reductase